ncbi:hypothetical protein P8452_45324 [Trifolium repens]|nr:hypothetical protein P8452_45324 [Trifolium repens]
MSRAWQLRNQLFDIHRATHFRSILVQNFSPHHRGSDMSSLNVRRQCALYCRVRYPRLQKLGGHRSELWK